MGATPTFSFPYPDLGNSPNVPADLALLAQAVEDRLTRDQRRTVAADVTVNNSTSMVDGTGLSFPLLAGQTYHLDGWIFYTSGVTPDIKFAWTGPAGMTVNAWSMAAVPVAGSGFDGTAPQVIGDANLQASSGDATLALAVRPGGVFVVGATAGTLQLRFAQNTANASNTILKAGSWLHLVRV